jgi:hypothetical protein
MVRIEEIRKAVTELPVEELRVYLEETIYEGIEEDSPEEEELEKILNEVIDEFVMGYSNPETRSGYKKMMELGDLNN